MTFFCHSLRSVLVDAGLKAPGEPALKTRSQRSTAQASTGSGSTRRLMSAAALRRSLLALKQPLTKPKISGAPHAACRGMPSTQSISTGDVAQGHPCLTLRLALRVVAHLAAVGPRAHLSPLLAAARSPPKTTGLPSPLRPPAWRWPRSWLSSSARSSLPA